LLFEKGESVTVISDPLFALVVIECWNLVWACGMYVLLFGGSATEADVLF